MVHRQLLLYKSYTAYTHRLAAPAYSYTAIQRYTALYTIQLCIAMLAPARVKNEEGDMRQDVKRSLYGFNKTHTLIQSTAINLCVGHLLYDMGRTRMANHAARAQSSQAQAQNGMGSKSLK